MIFKESFKMGLKDIDKENKIKNVTLLEFFENIGSYHSDIAGYGADYTKKHGRGWVLLDWKMQVLKRPKYGDILEVNTWAKTMNKATTYRDFEAYNQNKELCVIATSRWTMVNIKEGKIDKVDSDIIKAYDPEDKDVFEEKEVKKLKAPSEFSNEIEYKVRRKDIDINGHVHNIYYLDLAYEALPDYVYNGKQLDNIRIQYRKEIKLGETVKCRYTNNGNKHIVTIVSEDGKNIHAIIELS